MHDHDTQSVCITINIIFKTGHETEINKTAIYSVSPRRAE